MEMRRKYDIKKPDGTGGFAELYIRREGNNTKALIELSSRKTYV
jgi:hypothetical protein